MLTGKQKSIISNSAQWVVIISYSLAIILPLTYAIMRLEAVTVVSSIESIFKLAKAAKPSGRLSVDDIKRATPGKPSMTLKKGKLKGVKDAPEERAREAGARAMKKAGRLALRGYGKARK